MAAILKDEIRQRVEDGISNARVVIAGEGDKFQIQVVSPEFESQMPVRRQQMIYACINPLIADGSIHAVSLKTYTPAEWDKAQRMGIA